MRAVNASKTRLRLGLRPRPRWGNLQRSPRPPSWIWGQWGREERERAREGKGKGEKGEGRVRGREGQIPQAKILATALGRRVPKSHSICCCSRGCWNQFSKNPYRFLNTQQSTRKLCVNIRAHIPYRPTVSDFQPT